MRFHKPAFTLSILYKVLLVFLIIIVPLFALNLAINLWGAENLKNRISKSTVKHVEFWLDNFASEIKNIYEIQGLYIDDQNLKPWPFPWMI